MRIIFTAIIALTFLSTISSSARGQSKDDAKEDKSPKLEGFRPEQQKSSGSVTIASQAISYDTYAGTIVVHPKGWDDVPQNNEDKDEKSLPAQASMFLRGLFQIRRAEFAASADVFV
jgi:hypothetical protein